MKSQDLPLKEFNLVQHDIPILKLSLGMRLFFPRPFKKAGPGLKSFWEQFLAWVGKKTFTWSRLGGGNRSRAVSDSVFKTIDSWLSGKSNPGDTCWISIHDGSMDDLGGYSFFLEGPGEDPEQEDVGFVEIAVPVTFLDTLSADDLAARFIGLAADVPFLSGVAGFRFHHSPYKQRESAPSMAALSQRFQGVEVTFSDRMQYWAGKGLTTLNWITFVGEPFIEKFAGRSALIKRLPKECVVQTLKFGLAIRCGVDPSLGDRNGKKDELEAWRRLYRVLRPAQYVD